MACSAALLAEHLAIILLVLLQTITTILLWENLVEKSE